MGCTAGLKLRQVIDNVERILALELMSAAQGIDFRKSAVGYTARLGKGTQVAYDRLRERIPFIEQDTILYDYIEAARQLVSSGEMARAVNQNLQD
jgi:histidine ammonia-lyase